MCVADVMRLSSWRSDNASRSLTRKTEVLDIFFPYKIFIFWNKLCSPISFFYHSFSVLYYFSPYTDKTPSEPANAP